MSEREDVVAEYEASGVLAGVRWAYRSAAARAWADHSTPAGHNTLSLGTTRYVLFGDRLDRVFSTQQYEQDETGDAPGELDLLLAELPVSDVQSMPDLPAGLVRRSPLRGSPGWAVGTRRLLLASGEYGRLERILWRGRSATKQQVASQAPPPSVQDSLFAGAEADELRELEEAALAATRLDLDTLVLAHSLDPLTGHAELLLGRPKLNVGGGPAWHWYEDLLKTPPPGGGRLPDTAPMPSDPDAEDDAPVRLRQPGDQRPGQQRGGAA